eukprot:Nk52_evm35s1020 gene=Nk52_evmTU35s1020
MTSTASRNAENRIPSPNGNSDENVQGIDAENMRIPRMLELEICPGKSVGPLEIGMPIGTAISYLKRNARHIKNIDLKYGETNPFANDICINLCNDGMQLLFEPKTQCLRMIEIYDCSKVTLTYAQTTFNCVNSTAPTFVLIYKLFGPSYPGDYDSVHQQYILNYPGLSFYFPIPKQHESLYTNSKSGAELPLEFPDGTTPVTNRVCVYTQLDAVKSSRDCTKVPDLVDKKKRNYFQPVIGIINCGIFFPILNIIVRFGDSCEDVLSLLGAPSKVFYKLEDKMKIHSGSGNDNAMPQALVGKGSGEGSGVSNCSDYFYNYFDFGIDILFDSQRHSAKKFILHSNFPGHSDFDRYFKCNFFIASPSTSSEEVAGCLKNQEQLKKLKIGAFSDSTWKEIQSSFGEPTARPVVFNKGSSSSPFGSTYFYGYDYIIFEVMRNDHIGSVTLFSD